MGLLDTSRKYAEMSGRRELTVTDCTLALDNKGVELEDLNVSIVDHCDRRRQLHGPSSLPERLAAFLDKQTNPPHVRQCIVAGIFNAFCQDSNGCRGMKRMCIYNLKLVENAYASHTHPRAYTHACPHTHARMYSVFFL